MHSVISDMQHDRGGMMLKCQNAMTVCNNDPIRNPALTLMLTLTLTLSITETLALIIDMFHMVVSLHPVKLYCVKLVCLRS